MASATYNSRRPAKPIAADRYERALAIASALLLTIVLVAVLRGAPAWGRVPMVVWIHLATMTVALALTPVMLLRSRGDRRHRQLGRVWVGAMLLTAVDSFFVRTSHPGHFSPIHLLSIYVLVQAPLVWWSACTHRIVLHRRLVRGLVTGALLIAGFFTFPFHRLLGDWLFG